MEDTRNSIRIFQLKDGKETEVRVYPNPILDWRSFCYEDVDNLYNTLFTEVCKYFNVLDCPDALPTNVRYCWDTVTYVPICSDWSQEQKDAIYNDERYKLYEKMRLESDIVSFSDSMFNNAYAYIKRAAESRLDGQRHRGFSIAYLLEEVLRGQGANLKYCGCWILRDGSCVYVDTANHRRFIEEYLGLKELDMEQNWVKISMGSVYTHKNMNNAQWDTLMKLTKKYDLKMKEIGEW